MAIFNSYVKLPEGRSQEAKYTNSMELIHQILTMNHGCEPLKHDGYIENLEDGLPHIDRLNMW